MDGDKEILTICGTGLRTTSAARRNFENQKTRASTQEFTTLMPAYAPGNPVPTAVPCGDRFGLYRWHILDPYPSGQGPEGHDTGFGWRHDGRYNNQKSDIVDHFLVPGRAACQIPGFAEQGRFGNSKMVK